MPQVSSREEELGEETAAGRSRPQGETPARDVPLAWLLQGPGYFTKPPYSPEDTGLPPLSQVFSRRPLLAKVTAPA